MKKLLFTGITAALFSFAAIGQQQDSIQNPGNQFRPSDEQQQNPAATDTASTDFQQQQQDIDQPSNEFRQDAEYNRDSIERNDMERPGNQFQQNPDQAPDNSQNQLERTDQMDNQQGDQNSDETLDRMNDGFKSSVQDGSANYNDMPEVEVERSKEGPHNEVVYKYQGELYYVDRDKKELVKAKESDLEDANNDVIIEGSNEEDNNNR